jgi:hypothetical protein
VKQRDFWQYCKTITQRSCSIGLAYLFPRRDLPGSCVLFITGVGMVGSEAVGLSRVFLKSKNAIEGIGKLSQMALKGELSKKKLVRLGQNKGGAGGLIGLAGIVTGCPFG